MAKQLAFKGTKGWGGKRRGAGRPNRTRTVNHMRREAVDFRKPLHLTLKLNAGFATLRRKEFLHLFQHAIRKAKVFELHVLHYALLSNHIHILVEAEGNEALARGMQSLGVRLAKSIKRKTAIPGRVFSGRYHLRVITSPRQMRNSLEYVLLNRAKHTRDEAQLDTYSSASRFPDLGRLKWSRRLEIETYHLPENLPDIGLSAPRSWLAKTGWRKAA